MIEICDVPNFTYVLFHKGNDDDDTGACYLPGFSDGHGKNWISNSTEAYEIIYPQIIKAILDACPGRAANI